MRFILVIVVVVLVFGATFALKQALPGAENEAPAEVQDAISCDRLVSMSPGITETLFALGLGSQVVGVTRYCTYPPETAQRVQVGGFLDPNYEVLIGLRPDLILLTPFHRELRPELERLGLRYTVIPQDTVAEIRDSFLRLGALCGRQAQATALADDLDSRLARLAARAADRPRARVLMTTGREARSGSLDEVYAVSSGTFLSDLLHLVGGENCVTGKIAEYPALSAEGILQLNPEVIIEFGAEDSEEAAAAARAAWAALPGLQAVQEQRVYYLGGAQYTIPGPRIVNTLDALAACLHPEPGEAQP